MEAELAAEVSIIMACYSLLVQIADKICAHTYSRFLEINNLYEKVRNIISFFCEELRPAIVSTLFQNFQLF